MRTGMLRGGLWWGFAAREERAHRAEALEALDLVGMRDFASVQVQTLPYGLRKRVELARALAMEPRLLLLDEPVAGLNAAERAEMTHLVQTIHERGVTMLLVEHDMAMVMEVADRVLVLDFGRVIACATPTEVQRDDQVIRAYLGEELEVDAA
jgi:branched-chain amino acid transport system ATP-binding protein